ncbi:uncharacterized protein ACIB01_013746 [Guaruba guarouba]
MVAVLREVPFPLLTHRHEDICPQTSFSRGSLPGSEQLRSCGQPGPGARGRWRGSLRPRGATAREPLSTVLNPNSALPEAAGLYQRAEAARAPAQGTPRSAPGSQRSPEQLPPGPVRVGCPGRRGRLPPASGQQMAQSPREARADVRGPGAAERPWPVRKGRRGGPSRHRACSPAPGAATAVPSVGSSPALRLLQTKGSEGGSGARPPAPPRHAAVNLARISRRLPKASASPRFSLGGGKETRREELLLRKMSAWSQAKTEQLRRARMGPAPLARTCLGHRSGKSPRRVRLGKEAPPAPDPEGALLP